MSKHTPGPWCAGLAHGAFWRTIYGADAAQICRVFGQIDAADANARLIAAAPDLLMACKFVADKCNDPALVQIIDQAISKAEAQ